MTSTAGNVYVNDTVDGGVQYMFLILEKREESILLFGYLSPRLKNGTVNCVKSGPSSP